ncbi:MAG: XRE family transcriptional regulator [Enhygromyxa sp.]
MTEAKPAAKRTVSPRALEWARSRSLLSYTDVAVKLKRRTIDANTIEEWERGEGQPSAAQVRALAKIFRVPERWLYYEEPPRIFDDLGIVDFRTTDRRPLTRLSQNLRGAIEHALAVQAWVAEHRARSQDERVVLVGARSVRDSARAVADYLRKTLGVEQLRGSAKDAAEFFKALRRQVEALGVLVLRMGQVANKTAWSLDPDEFKGFTLIDEDQLAPLIFINRKDLDDAQLFTLGHELAHLVTGGSGVSNEAIEDFDEDKSDVERFCDEVAEELLVPVACFEQAWGKSTRGLELDEGRIEGVAAELKVTSLLAGRRAVTLKRVTPRSFFRLVATRREQPVVEKKAGGSPYISMPSWYGTDLVRLLASAATTEHPSGSDALELLGVTFDTAIKLAQVKQVQRGGLQKEREVGSASGLPRMERFPLVEIDDSWRVERR